ncbi:hypothetical protein Poli38472_009679 [Pythium oligandrum]|uniref:SCD domain-containing protein n=1 Tax=Pythium oligandrum TaxID=41045 RepID=A0A8K1CG28_PYTOL|nr:hypothetical protein Poli38472_009679 [Pythium oligandrum]|eukprot:TMW62186.1 hypothetical protein Poli38472_009679 [Pythium oligandrum]
MAGGLVTSEARRSTRERKKPKPIYEVEDRRVVYEDVLGEDGVLTVNDGDASDMDVDEDDDEEEEEEDAFVPPTPKSAERKKRATPSPKPPRAKRPRVVKPRKLKPVMEERPRQQASRPKTGAAGEAGATEGNQGDAEDGEDGEDDDDVFFESVKRGKCSMRDLLGEWRERYEEDPDLATREVLNFVLQACGAEGQCVPPTESLEKLDMSDLVDYVVGDLKNSNGAYPLGPRVKTAKKFHENFVDFWEALIQECYESELLFSKNVVGQLVDWLTTLSSAEVRAIRHTTTVAAYAMGTAIVDCAAKISQQLSVVQRQLNAESKSKTKSPGKNPMSRKLEQLHENKKTYEGRRDHVLEMSNLLFNAVLVHRYRDVMPEVRLESVQTLGAWATTLPDHYLKDNYLKYLGWMLNDKSADVRLGVVKMLRELYENEAFAEKLELFTSRFLARFLEMCGDVDDNVVHACVKLLIAVDKRSLISSDVELHSIEMLVFDENNEEIRKAAAEFVCLQYDAFGVAESKKTAKLTKDQLNTQTVALVEFAEEYITHHHVPPEAVETMVDAFWGLDDCQVLQDWKLLLNVLLVDKDSPDLTSEQQTLLVRLLVASVSMSVSDDREHNNAVAKKQLAQVKEEIAVTFCKELPTLLVRFQSDTEKLSLLADLVPLLTLGSDIALQPSHIKSLLDKLKNAYLSNADEVLLKTLALSIHHLRKSEHEVIKRESDVIIRELYQTLFDKLDEQLEEDERVSVRTPSAAKKAKSKRRSAKDKGLADTEFALQTSLGRVCSLAGLVNPREYLPDSKQALSSPTRRSKPDTDVDMDISTSRMDRVVSCLVDLIRRRTVKVVDLDEAFLQPDAIKFALMILYSDLLWQTQPIFERSSQDGAEPTDESVVDGESFELTRRVKASRAFLGEALVSTLEMHLEKTQHTSESTADDIAEQDDSQIAMEEIVFDNPLVESYVKSAQSTAFLTFCDTRCLFVERFQDSPAPYNSLEWTMPKVLMLLTQMYFENEMEATVSDQPEDEEGAEDVESKVNKEDSRQRKTQILAALGRASLCNPSNKRQAAAVLRFFADSDQQNQQVVKAFSKQVKSESPVRYLEVQMTALRQVYNNVLAVKEELESNEHDEATEEELQESIDSSELELKELAKKLSQSLGVGKIAASLRAPFFRFLCEGVRFSLERQIQFSFLEAVKPYLSHLDKSSTKQLHAYFEQMLERVEDVPSEGDDVGPEWRIVFAFRSSISASDRGTKAQTSKTPTKQKQNDSNGENGANEVEANDAVVSITSKANAEHEISVLATNAQSSKSRRRSSILPSKRSTRLSDDESEDDDEIDNKSQGQAEVNGGDDRLENLNETRKSKSSDTPQETQPTPPKARRSMRALDAANQVEEGESNTNSKDAEKDAQGEKEREDEEEEEEIDTRRSRRRGRARS